MVRFDRMTHNAQEAVQRAVALAGEHNHQEVGTDHLLLALLALDESVAVPVLQRAGVDLGALRSALDQALAARARVEG